MTKDEIIEWVFKNQNIKKYCQVLCSKKGIPNDWSDLHAELIGQIYKMNYEKLLLARQGNFLEYIAFTISKRILYGNVKGSGIFYKPRSTEEIEVFDEEIYELYQDRSNERLEYIFEIVEGSHWYSKTLFKEYYQNGMKLREISEKYGINPKSIHYSIKKLKEEIIKKLELYGKKPI